MAFDPDTVKPAWFVREHRANYLGVLAFIVGLVWRLTRRALYGDVWNANDVIAVSLLGVWLAAVAVSIVGYVLVEVLKGIFEGVSLPRPRRNPGGFVTLPVPDLSVEDVAIDRLRRDYLNGDFDADELEQRVERVLTDEQYRLSLFMGGLPPAEGMATRPERR
jgi:hypothetical protein